MPPDIGSDFLRGAVDCHIHACPHINGRSVNVFEAVRNAAGAGMRAIGLMDNFSNSAGYAALANRELGHLGVEVFGGLIMEPPAGGVSAEAVSIALSLGYGPPFGPGTGARFISLPTHHTRHTARQEGRSPTYVEGCLEVPERGPLPGDLPAILDLISRQGAVLNTGHISAREAIRLVEIARARGIDRILVPSSHFEPAEVKEIARLGGMPEFSYFFASIATKIGLTHVDAEKHTVAEVTATRMAELIRAAGPRHCVVSSDCGVYVLPPPHEGLREFVSALAGNGIALDDLHLMTHANPARLFNVARQRCQ